MTNKTDKNQTPAPKVSSGKVISDKDKGSLKKNFAERAKGADDKTTATKTPQKVQDGNLTNTKQEDKP